MKIENVSKLELYADGKRARVVVSTYVDGKLIGINTATEGRLQDVVPYFIGAFDKDFHL